MSEYVWRNIRLSKIRLLLFILLFALSVILFVMNKLPYAILGLIMIPLSYTLAAHTYKRYVTWASGVIGETTIIEELMNLDDTYHLINSVIIPPNRGDADHIIIGRNGIFVIESKNYGGKITCNGDEWSRRKKSRKGNVYEMRIGSPSKQVKRNATTLKSLILEHKGEIFKNVPRIWVNGILVFTNKNADIHINNPTVNILMVDELCDFIRHQNNLKLSEGEVKKISKMIMKYST